MQNYIILLFISFIFACLELKNKKIKKIGNIPILLGYLIYIFNKKNFDYPNYVLMFEALPSNKYNIEIGFLYLMKFFKYFYNSYDSVIFFVGTLFFYNYFFSKKNNYRMNSVIFCLYSIYYFIFDINQIRNLVMITLIYMALNKGFKNNKKYFILNLMAITFHKLGIIYLLFGFLKKIEFKKFCKIIILGVGLSFLSLEMFKYFSLNFYPEKSKFYFSLKPNYGVLVFYIMIALDLFIIYLAKGFKENSFKEETYLKFYLFMILFLPISALSLEIVGRVYRNTFLIKCIFLTMKMRRISLMNRYVIFILLLINTTIPLVIDYYKNSYFVISLLQSL